MNNRIFPCENCGNPFYHTSLNIKCCSRECRAERLHKIKYTITPVPTDESALIPLTKGRYAIVDKDDFEELSRHIWYCGGDGYAARRETTYDESGVRMTRIVKMHRIIINAPNDVEVDHINRNRIDNRRSNLRLCTRSENATNRARQANSHGRFKGITFAKNANLWRARIHVHGKTIQLGYFQSDIDAARAYDRAAIQYFGEFALLNFPNTSML